MTAEEKAAFARTAGLRDFNTPELEDVDRRRSQLWLLSLVFGLAIPAAIIALGFDSLQRVFGELVDMRTVRLVLLALLVALAGYVAERERALRNLTKLLVEERVLTATLVSRVAELDALLEASRAMNSSLNLDTVLDVILRSACDLLDAAQGSIQLADPDEPGILRVAAVQGSSSAQVGQRQVVGEGLAGSVAQRREAVLVTGRHDGSKAERSAASALLAPLVTRGDLVGVLNVSGSARGGHFNEFQLRSVAVFAETAAAAIANARAHELSEERVAALTELDRMKGEFLQLVTHELRTPLTSLIGLATTIAGNAERLQPPQVRQLAEMTRSQGWRLERLVNDLLQSAEAQRGTLRLEPTDDDPRTVVREVVDGFRSTTATHEFHLDVPSSPLVCGVDADAVSRILTNLVGNAVKYAPEGTTVHVGLRAAPGGIVLSVADQGPGIPPEQREELFAKFRRGPMVADVGGLGLGLYIVRCLAEAHGGEATVRPAPSGGSEFIVTLGDLRPVEHAPETVEVSAR